MGVIGRFDDIEPVGKGIFTAPNPNFNQTEEERIQQKGTKRKKKQLVGKG